MFNPEAIPEDRNTTHARKSCEKNYGDFEFGVHVLLVCLILTMSYISTGYLILSSAERQNDAYFLEELYFFCHANTSNLTSDGEICESFR